MLWGLVAAAAASVSLALGLRQTFGLFLLPLAQEHAIAPGMLGAAVAIANLVWGLSQPVSGALSDRFGAGRLIALGGLFYIAGLGMVALWPNATTVMLGIGILSGLGVSFAGTGTALGAVGRAVPPEKRAEMIGLASAGGSLGQAAMIPLAQNLIGAWGSAAAMGGLAVIAITILGVARGLEWQPAPQRGPAPTGLSGLPALARAALRDRDYALLTAGFFACGFQLAFLTVHLPAYLTLCGLPAPMGATALMLVGLFNIPGSWLCGKSSAWVRPEWALGGIYLLRSIAILVFISSTPSEWGAAIFAGVMGLVWLGTIPLTSAAIARRFGVADLGALYGVCFLSHQLGGFLGAGAGSVLMETTGNYDAFWPVMIVVGLLATALNWMIRPPRTVMA